MSGEASRNLDQKKVGEALRSLLREELPHCLQCGACSAQCPASFAMDYTPRQFVNMIHMGLWDEIFSSSNLWICLSCYACTVRCPQGANLAAAIEGLKSFVFGEKLYTRPEMKFYEVFMDAIRKNGRVNEISLFVKGVKTSEVLKMLGFGFKLLRKGTIKLRPEKMRNLDYISSIFKRQREGS